jgi:hypothetical protein
MRREHSGSARGQQPGQRHQAGDRWVGQPVVREPATAKLSHPGRAHVVILHPGSATHEPIAHYESLNLPRAVRTRSAELAADLRV